VDLDSADAIFLGEAAGDGIGEQGMLHPADVDGDGFDDILIGGHLHDSGGSDAGAAYLVYGGR
jgi:hypothetical protein